MRLVFVGTGRCGTKYVSVLCRAMGLDIGHEEVFNLNVFTPDFEPVWSDAAGDSSWLALGWPGVGGCYVVHVVRKRVDVEASYRSFDFFTAKHDDSPFRRAMKHIVPGLRTLQDPEDRLTAWINGALWAAGRIANEVVRVDAITPRHVHRWGSLVARSTHAPTTLPPTDVNTHAKKL